jgi:hypothetical protein
MSTLRPSSAGQPSRPQSAQGRLQTSALQHSRSTRNGSAFLSYRDHKQSTVASSKALNGNSRTDNSGGSSSSPSASWSQRLLANAQSIAPSSHSAYSTYRARPSTSPHPVPIPAATLDPVASALSSLYLPTDPYLIDHLRLLEAQLGRANVALYINDDENDGEVLRLVKKQVRAGMKEEERARQQTRQDDNDEQRKTAADGGSEDDSSSSSSLSYPFTRHCQALRDHVLTLSSLHSSFSSLISSLSASTSLHPLLSSFSSSYLSLFSSLLSSLFSLNHHYHYINYRLHAALSSSREHHLSQLRDAQQRIELLSHAHHAQHHLHRIEESERHHHEQQLRQLSSLLRHGAEEALTEAAAAAGSSKREDVMELSGDSFLHSHHLSLLLSSLLHEDAEGDDARQRLDRLLVEGKKSVKELWQSTLAKKREDEAQKQKEKRSRERKQLLTITTLPSAASTPRSVSPAAFALNSFTLLPSLSRFMHNLDTITSPRSATASSTAAAQLSLNAQLLSIVAALPPFATVQQFPSHVLSCILNAQSSVPEAQRHLRSLFSLCTVQRQQPMPRLFLQLIATSSEASWTPARCSSFTLQMVTAALRFFRPLMDRELLLPLPTLQSHIAQLLSLFFQPSSSSLLTHLTGVLESHSLQPSMPVLDFAMAFASSYQLMLTDWLQLVVGRGRLGLAEVGEVLRQLDCERWGGAAGTVGIAKEERVRLYVDWLERCSAAGNGTEVEELHLLLDAICTRGWLSVNQSRLAVPAS